MGTAITGACGKPGPGASGLGDDPELFNTEADLSLWKNCEGGRRGAGWRVFLFCHRKYGEFSYEVGGFPFTGGSSLGS